MSKPTEEDNAAMVPEPNHYERMQALKEEDLRLAIEERQARITLLEVERAWAANRLGLATEYNKIFGRIAAALEVLTGNRDQT